MAVNQLLPVPLSRTGGDSRLGQYPVRTARGKWYGDNLIQAADERRLCSPQPGFYFSGSRSEEGRAHPGNYPFMYSRGFGGCGQTPSSTKSTVKLRGTYDMNGELTSEIDGKGLYIDHFS